MRVEYRKKRNTWLLTPLRLATACCLYDWFPSPSLFCDFLQTLGKKIYLSLCLLILEVQHVNWSRISNLENWPLLICRVIICCLYGDSDISRLHMVVYYPMCEVLSWSSRSHELKYRSLMNYESPAVKMDRGHVRSSAVVLNIYSTIMLYLLKLFFGVFFCIIVVICFQGRGRTIL